jgi:hypothetical protein
VIADFGDADAFVDAAHEFFARLRRERPTATALCNYYLALFSVWAWHDALQALDDEADANLDAEHRHQPPTASRTSTAYTAV